MFPTFEPRRRAVSYHGDGRDDREIEDRKEQDERRKKIDDVSLSRIVYVISVLAQDLKGKKYIRLQTC